ncbi:MAG: DUF302 domain-containing protein [Sulfuricaulis sp.]
MSRFFLLIIVFGLFASPFQAVATTGANRLKLYITHDNFDAVQQDVEIAIVNHGLVVDHVSHISAMLDRTGKDLGMKKSIYAKAESMQFCSAVISRQMMKADPSNIVYCPYVIVIYSLPQDPKTVYVGYRRPLPVGSQASRTSLKAVEELLDGVVKEALGLK